MSTTRPPRHRRWVVALGVVVALDGVAIGGSIAYLASGGGTRAYHAKGQARIEARALPGAGTALVTGDGKSLYAFEPDQASKVTCTGLCTWDWPPFVLDAKATVRAGTGVDANAVGSVPNPAGGRVVTYHGWPLYTFSSDTAGQARGQGRNAYGGRWHIMAPSGPSGLVEGRER